MKKTFIKFFTLIIYLLIPFLSAQKLNQAELNAISTEIRNSFSEQEIRDFNREQTKKLRRINGEKSLPTEVNSVNISDAKIIFKPMPQYIAKNQNIVLAGKLLFESKTLSGRRNISCLTCHDPQKGTSDGLPLSLGQGEDRKIGPGPRDRKILRHSQTLFNLKHPENTVMFWDGKVSLIDEVLTTPVKELNGPIETSNFKIKTNIFDTKKTKKIKAIRKMFKHSLDVASIIPILARAEMLGLKEDLAKNDPLKNVDDPFKIWQIFVDRILNEHGDITNLLMTGFGLNKTSDMNIGHIAIALSDFMGQEFQLNNTPFDRFLRGDNSALTTSQLKGFLLFRNHCGSCHGGTTLAGEKLEDNDQLNEFIFTKNAKGKLIKKENPRFIKNFKLTSKFSSAFVPMVGVFDERVLVNQPMSNFDNPWPFTFVLDTGREKTNTQRITDDTLAFKIPPLRGINISAPYFHNGVFSTLEQVVEHYSNVQNSVRNYQRLPADYHNLYNGYISMLTGGDNVFYNTRLFTGFNLLKEGLRDGINFTQQEKQDLVNFLRALN